MDIAAIINYDSIGLIGVILYISSYAALQLGLVQGSGYTYTLMNLAAATFVLVSLMESFNLSSAIIQITWITISIFGLSRMFFLQQVTRLNAEETAFIKSKFPSVTKPLARQFLNVGFWIEDGIGTAIATEGQPIGALVYLYSGNAIAELAGKPLGRLEPDSFIGEMTCFDAGPATATVKLVGKSRYFRITTEALNKICNRNPDLKMAVENAIGRDTRMKLVAANMRISDQSPKTN